MENDKIESQIVIHNLRFSDPTVEIPLGEMSTVWICIP
jgi:hypothetical protein